MTYAVTLALTVGLLLTGCGQKEPEKPETGPAGSGEGQAAGKTLRGAAPQIKNAQPGERWVLRNRVPLMDEPSEYGNKQAFKKHMLARLSAGAKVTVLETKNDAWLKVKTVSPEGGGTQKGWISANNVLRADRASAGQQK